MNGPEHEQNYGTKLVRITDVSVIGAESRGPCLMSGEYAEICVSFYQEISQDELTVGITDPGPLRAGYFSARTLFMPKCLFPVKKIKNYVCCFSMKNGPRSGEIYGYRKLSILERAHIASCFNWKDRAADFEVAGVREFSFTRCFPPGAEDSVFLK